MKHVWVENRSSVPVLVNVRGSAYGHSTEVSMLEPGDQQQFFFVGEHAVVSYDLYPRRSGERRGLFVEHGELRRGLFMQHEEVLRIPPEAFSQ